MKKTMKLSSLINSLIEIKAHHGDLPVVLASDYKGNFYGALNEDFLFYVENHVIAIYPTCNIGEKIYEFEAE